MENCNKNPQNKISLCVAATFRPSIKGEHVFMILSWGVPECPPTYDSIASFARATVCSQRIQNILPSLQQSVASVPVLERKGGEGPI